MRRRRACRIAVLVLLPALAGVLVLAQGPVRPRVDRYALLVGVRQYDPAQLHPLLFAEADVEALPFEERRFDLVVTYTGLHCFPDPPAAIAEMARVLRPGGELRGTSVIKRTGLRQDTFVRLMQLGGIFGPGQTLAELETSLADAGLVKVSTSRSGALAYLSAQRPGGNQSRGRSS